MQGLLLQYTKRYEKGINYWWWLIEATGEPKEYVMMVRIFHQNETMSLQKYLNLNPKSRPLLPFVRTQEEKGYERVVCLTLTSRGVTEETFHWNAEQQALTPIEVNEKPEFGALSMEAWRYQNNVMRGIIDVFTKLDIHPCLKAQDSYLVLGRSLPRCWQRAMSDPGSVERFLIA